MQQKEENKWKNKPNVVNVKKNKNYSVGLFIVRISQAANRKHRSIDLRGKSLLQRLPRSHWNLSWNSISPRFQRLPWSAHQNASHSSSKKHMGVYPIYLGRQPFRKQCWSRILLINDWSSSSALPIVGGKQRRDIKNNQFIPEIQLQRCQSGRINSIQQFSSQHFQLSCRHRWYSKSSINIYLESFENLPTKIACS